MMRIKEFIDRLQTALEENGDLPIGSTDSFYDAFVPDSFSLSVEPIDSTKEQKILRISPIFERWLDEI